MVQQTVQLAQPVPFRVIDGTGPSMADRDRARRHAVDLARALGIRVLGPVQATRTAGPAPAA